MKTLLTFLLLLTAPAWATPPADNAPDWYYPQWLAEAPHAPGDIDLFQDLQWAYAKKLVSRSASESVDVTDIPVYTWPEPPCKDMGKRRDNDYKDVPEAHLVLILAQSIQGNYATPPRNGRRMK